MEERGLQRGELWAACLPTPLGLPAWARRLLIFGPTGAKPGYAPYTVTPWFPSRCPPARCARGWPPAPIVPIQPWVMCHPPSSAGLPQVGPAAAQLDPELIA